MGAYWRGGMLDISHAHTYICALTYTLKHLLAQAQTAGKLIQTAEYLTSEDTNSFIFSRWGRT